MMFQTRSGVASNPVVECADAVFAKRTVFSSGHATKGVSSPSELVTCKASSTQRKLQQKQTPNLGGAPQKSNLCLNPDPPCSPDFVATYKWQQKFHNTPGNTFLFVRACDFPRLLCWQALQLERAQRRPLQEFRNFVIEKVHQSP